MSDGNITHTTYANAAVTVSQASSDLLEVTIPASSLTDGVNRIGVEEHVNYKGTASMTSIWLQPWSNNAAIVSLGDGLSEVVTA